MLSPLLTVCAPIVPTASGAPFGTVTVKPCCAVRLPSLAVTVTVALPCDAPVSVTTVPVTATLTLAASDEATVYSRVSSSAALGTLLNYWNNL